MAELPLLSTRSTTVAAMCTGDISLINPVLGADIADCQRRKRRSPAAQRASLDIIAGPSKTRRWLL